MNELMPILTDALVTVAVALISLLSAYAVRAVSKLTGKLQLEATRLETEEQRTLAADALATVNDLVSKTVTCIEQVAAKSLREQVKSGEISQDALKQLGLDALDEVYTSLSPQYRKALERSVGNVETYIKNAIEAKVWELKNCSLELLDGSAPTQLLVE